jgi:hypothetical protein
MAQANSSKPAPKISSTKTPVAKLGEKGHDEKMIDEALDESFPASDPAAITQPSSTLAVKKIAEEGRKTPRAEPDPAQRHVRPRKDKK